MYNISIFFKKTNWRCDADNPTRHGLNGNREARLDVFAEAAIVTATQAVGTARLLADLANEDRERTSGLDRAAASSFRVHQTLMGHPITDSKWLLEKTGIIPATVNKSLEHLERLGIVRELTSRKRNRIFSYAGYLEIMNQGTELPD